MTTPRYSLLSVKKGRQYHEEDPTQRKDPPNAAGDSKPVAQKKGKV